MANFVPGKVSLPRSVRTRDIRSLAQFTVDLAKVLSTVFIQIGQRLNGALMKDGTEAMTAPLLLKTYSIATRPTASTKTGTIIYVSDGAAGSKFQGSDGTSWVSLG